MNEFVVIIKGEDRSVIPLTAWMKKQVWYEGIGWRIASPEQLESFAEFKAMEEEE